MMMLVKVRCSHNQARGDHEAILDIGHGEAMAEPLNLPSYGLVTGPLLAGLIESVCHISVALPASDHT